MSRHVVLEVQGKCHDLGQVNVPLNGENGNRAIRAANEVTKCFYNLDVSLDSQSKFYLVVQAVAAAFSGKKRDRELEEDIIRLFMGFYSDEYERMMSSRMN